MAAQHNSRRHLLWLALGTAFMAAAMAILLVLQLTQQQAIRESSALRSDSITALAFQLEREFLRLRQSIDVNAHREAPIDLEGLRLRSDVFASRFQLMHDTPSTTALQDRDEYRQTMPRLQALLAQVDAALLPPAVPTRTQLQKLLHAFNDLGPELQNLTMAATRQTAVLLEAQELTMLEQGRQIMALIVALLAFLLAAAAVLAWRQRRVEKERQQLRELTQNLQEANLAAEAASRGKSQFLANMSHELRTPFNGVLGMLNLLERTALTPRQQEYVSTARGSADHLLSLLNDILDISAMETGKMGIHAHRVDLSKLVAGIEHLMQPLAQQKGLLFATHCAADLPCWISADGTRIKQIVLNLLTNAIKFSEAGRVELRLLRDTQAPGGGQAGFYPLRLEVKDQGIGMDAATLSKLFQRFSQGDDSTSRRFGGTGLGLEISRTLARRMGGEISVASAPGQGSTFTVTLPLRMTEAPDSSPTGGADDPIGTRPAGVPGLKVLVADDHVVNRQYMTALLQDMGHTVVLAQDGVEAFTAAQAQRPDLVLMDLHMPTLDGFGATREIRKMVSAEQLPIVALTADVFEQTRHKATECGMSGFIGKPVNVGELQTLLTGLFGVRGAPVQTEPELPSGPALLTAAEPAPEQGPPTTAGGTDETPALPRRSANRRRFRPGDVETHLDMTMVGEVCIGVSAEGYRTLLRSFFSDESGALDALLLALDEPGHDLRGSAHAFKGASANLGFRKLAAMALALEQQSAPAEPGVNHSTRNELLSAWETAHALCLRMGLTDVAAPHGRHVVSQQQTAPAQVA